MPAAASWFQVNCPACTAALQVRLPAGETAVACSEALMCHTVFTVKVLPAMLKAAEAAAPVATRHIDKQEVPRRVLSAYNLYIKSEVARLRRADRTLDRIAAWKRASASWAGSPMNPKNTPAGPAAAATAAAVPAAPAPAGAAAAAAAAALPAVGGPPDLMVDNNDDDAAARVLLDFAAPTATAGAVTAGGQGGGGEGRRAPRVCRTRAQDVL